MRWLLLLALIPITAHAATCVLYVVDLRTGYAQLGYNYFVISDEGQ